MCPSDAVASAGTVCRAADFACDAAEQCDGDAADCPSNVLLAVGAACQTAPPTQCVGAPALVDGVCTDGGQCSAPLPVGCECVSASDCDDGNACTVDECDAGTCRNDTPAPADAVCRPAKAGGCDVAEQCNGISLACPDDVVEASGVVCR